MTSLIRKVRDKWRFLYDLTTEMNFEFIQEDPVINGREKELGDVCGDGARWRSDVQREAVQAIVERESPIVVILPMAGGKSACICISARQNEDDKTTIVVVPHEKSARDIVKGSQAHKIPTIHWQENCQNRGRHSGCA